MNDRKYESDKIVQVTYGTDTMVTLYIELPHGLTVDSPSEVLEPVIMDVIQRLGESPDPAEWPPEIIDFDLTTVQ
jgi:hypothetical protein